MMHAPLFHPFRVCAGGRFRLWSGGLQISNMTCHGFFSKFKSLITFQANFSPVAVKYSCSWSGQRGENEVCEMVPLQCGIDFSCARSKENVGMQSMESTEVHRGNLQ